MRSIAPACVLLLGMASAALGQAIGNETRSGDVALNYHWVHTNAPPNGGCGCFPLNGVAASGSWNFRPKLAAVAEVGVDHTSNALSLKKSLTLTSYMAGARYRVPGFGMNGRHGLQPFIQLLVGGAHAGGGEAGVADGTSAFAGRLGGGIDVPLSARFVARVQGDYFMTMFANTADNRQNNILFGAGIVFRWSR
ncbi:MAG: hypothetical protein M3Y50_11540 [Acidobacteriota bacterium]|nr:hypothetical protein [Acidobacteriota bacterium]